MTFSIISVGTSVAVFASGQRVKRSEITLLACNEISPLILHPQDKEDFYLNNLHAISS